MKTIKYVVLLASLLIATSAFAQAATRTTNLNWGAVSGAQGYNLYRSTTSGSGYSKVNSTVLTTNTYSDTTTNIGTVYFYVVTTVNPSCTSVNSPTTTTATSPCGESAFSSEIAIGVGPRPQITTVMTATVP